MNFKDINNKEELKKEVHSLTNEYSKMLLQWIDSSSPSDYKRAALLFYWLRDYKSMISYESQFDPHKLRKYSRGDVISINLGFNPGGEEGGRHYAVVMEDNPRSASTVTIVPLRSKKPKDMNGPHWSELSIGDEISVQLRTKLSTLKPSFNDNISSVKRELAGLSSQLESVKQIINHAKEAGLTPVPPQKEQDSNENLAEIASNITELYANIQEQIKEATARLDHLQNRQQRLEQCKSQFRSMKSESIAMTGKITTLSKLRISDPLHENDILDGIRISKKTMDKICQKLEELYCKNNSSNC